MSQCFSWAAIVPAGRRVHGCDICIVYMRGWNWASSDVVRKVASSRLGSKRDRRGDRKVYEQIQANENGYRSVTSTEWVHKIMKR